METGKLFQTIDPLSGLPTLSKIFEKAISSRLLNFINKHSIISNKQFGFQKNKSTSDAILSMIEYIYSSLNDRKTSISVFIDLKKAFDTVNHSILLRKLNCYGIRGLPLELLASYLSDRKQCVKVGDAISNYQTVNIGVPQGSVLAPLLFILYINDLPVSTKLNTVLFADDSTIYGSSSDATAFFDEFNTELSKIFEWTCVNRLSLNVSKTYAMLFSNRNLLNSESHNIKLDDQVIEFLENGNFLGVTIDTKLNFSYHIKNICIKLSKTIGLFYKLRFDVPRVNLIKLYYSLFYPYLLYCNKIWGGTYDSHLKPVLLLQKKIIRIIMGEGYLSHTCTLFFQAKKTETK